MGTFDAPPTLGDEIRRAEIARLAYLRWERAGRPSGSDRQHWLEAEQEWNAQHPPTDGNPAYPKLEEREQLVEQNAGKSEPVRKIPASDLARPTGRR